jgi:hypothetical protein
MKLTYWIADCLHDAPCYSVRERTRKEVVAEVKLIAGEANANAYGKPRKVVVEYTSAFGLMKSCLGEGGLLAEARHEHVG